MVAMILDSGAPVELLEFQRDVGDGSMHWDFRRRVAQVRFCAWVFPSNFF
jgi:hypothetical protein